MTIDVIRLGLGLLLLIAVNIVLGSIDAWLSGQFDKPKLLRGICKGAVVALCFAVTYLVGWLNPEVVAISINGQAVTLLTAVYLIIMAGFLFYAAEVIGKLAGFVKGKVKVGELTMDATAPAEEMPIDNSSAGATPPETGPPLPGPISDK